MLEKNRIYNRDCVDGLKSLEKGSVDLVFADPPFNIGYEYDVYEDSRESSDYLKWSREWIRGVHRALKPDGTFWLAIGDEYAAELKIEAQKAGFHCRSWVIWYYTFGVNCVNGFSRSHTHLFHFVKDPNNFTFNRFNPQIRVKSARQLVYADARANPNGRLPDNTWILRPQDAPESFSPNHDTWYFARVAGTFAEREGFHGCQMPEQLLARVVLSSSQPGELVVDPFGGSGTTLCVAKKLGRQYVGFELSQDYATYIQERLDRIKVNDAIDGPEDPIESAPSTARGKQRKSPAKDDAEKIVVAAYHEAGQGVPSDYLLCNKELNSAFIAACRSRGDGSPHYWNHLMLALRKAGKLPKSNRDKWPSQITPKQMEAFGFASEVAWRLIAIDYRKTLDEILCAPEFAAEFDRLANEFGPSTCDVSSCDYRRAALSIRKRSEKARDKAAREFSHWIHKRRKLVPVSIDDVHSSRFEIPGVFVLQSASIGIYAGESNNIRSKIEQVCQNPNWIGLNPDSFLYVPENGALTSKYALKSALARRENPLLNCRLLVHSSELSA